MNNRVIHFNRHGFLNALRKINSPDFGEFLRTAITDPPAFGDIISQSIIFDYLDCPPVKKILYLAQFGHRNIEGYPEYSEANVLYYFSDLADINAMKIILPLINFSELPSRYFSGIEPLTT